MSKKKFDRSSYQGVIVPLITPLMPSGEVDKKNMKKLVRFMLDSGVDALMPSAGSGECVCLSYKQRIDAVEACVEETQGKCPVIGGAMLPGYGDSRDLALSYKKVGADAVMVFPPYYVDIATQDDIVDYFARFLDEVDMPMMIENLPSRVKTNMLPESYLRLVKKNPLFVAVKECTLDVMQYSEVLALVGDKINVLTGYEGNLAPMLMLGAKGGVLAGANALPELCTAMVAAGKSKNYDLLLKLHFDAMKTYNKALYATPHPGPLRIAVAHRGIENGEPVLPTKMPDEKASKNINKVVDEILTYLKKIPK